MSNYPDDMDFRRYDAVYGGADDATMDAVDAALAEAAKLRAIIERAVKDIEALRFGSVAPVAGLDVSDIISMMRLDFMPISDAEIIAQVEENAL
jgi:hypothetical protein